MPALVNWMMVFLRASGMLSIFPVFSSRNLPPLTRIALAALLGFLVAPLLPNNSLPATTWALIGAMAVELCSGLLLGFVSRLIFYALEMTGVLIATEMGLALSAAIDPVSDIQTTAPSILLHYLTALIWLTLDLHHWLLLGFQRTYQFLPVAHAHLPEDLLLDLLSRTSHLFVLATQMAAPVMAVSFLVTLVFSMLSRAVPQMNVFSESFSFRLLAGLAVFGLTLQLMAQHIANYLRRLPEDILRIAQLLGSA